MIEGKYVNLRALEKEDLELLKKWRNDKRTRTHTREYRLLNMINQREWFETIHKQNPPTVIMFGIENLKRKFRFKKIQSVIFGYQKSSNCSKCFRFSQDSDP